MGGRQYMKTLAIVSLLCLGTFLVMGIGMAYAANDDMDFETSAVSLTIPASCILEIYDSASTKVLVQDNVDSDHDFDVGQTQMPENRPNLKVSANKNWVLSAKAVAWTCTSGGYAKAVGDLQLKHDGKYVQGSFKNFTPLATDDQVIASNAIGVFDEVYNCQYQIKLDYTKDVPGVYTTTVTYTLVSAGV